jgi:hypothetical protein
MQRNRNKATLSLILALALSTISSAVFAQGQRDNSRDTPRTTSSRYEGIVRQVSPADSRLVIENDDHERLTIIGTPTTPVYYQRETYRIENIEVGDRIRVEPSSTGDEIRARSIEVVSSVSQGSGNVPRTNTPGTISGRITFVDTRANTFRVDIGRGTDVTVDVGKANDDKNRRVKSNDFLIGDRITATGNWVGQNTFRATSIHWGIDGPTTGGPNPGGPGPGGSGPGPGGPPPSTGSGDGPGRPDYITVVVYGTVQDVQKGTSTITVKDKDMDRTVRVMMSEDFAIRTKNGNYVMADTLKQGDLIVVKAFRDNYGN